MATKNILERVRLRISKEEASDEILNEYIDVMKTRLCLRLREDELPTTFEPICADATVKMFRRTYYEGIKTDGTEGLNSTFVDDILKEYEYEICEYRARTDAQNNTVKFL